MPRLRWIAYRPRVGPVYYVGKLKTIPVCHLRLSLSISGAWELRISLPTDLEVPPAPWNRISSVKDGQALAEIALEEWLHKTGLLPEIEESTQ